MNQEFSSGLDDILGQQAIQQLNYHLNSVMKATTKQMTLKKTRRRWMIGFLNWEKARASESQLKSEIEALKVQHYEFRSTELHNMIMSKGHEEGKNLGNARAVQARAASHLDRRN